MKIIDIAICIDNVDPENLGRIRCLRYSQYTGEIENAFNYKKWDDKDLFVATPFLPTNINFIPEIGQSVKIINYNTDKETVNIEYISGPFNTRHDFNSQNYSTQLEKTTYGLFVKHGKNIVDENGFYLNKKSEGAFAKHTDYGVYGKYGSDVLFTENGLVLRGGKLKDKNSSTPDEKVDMLYEPIMSKKIASLHLKKYSNYADNELKTVTKEVYPVLDLNYMVEYEITNFQNSTSIPINFYIYKLTKTYNNLYTTINPSLRTINLVDGYYKLINTDNTNTTPTFTIISETTDTIPSVVRDVLQNLHNKDLSYYNEIFTKEKLHPFYFRPTSGTSQTILTNTTEINNRKDIFNKITLNKISGPESGLVINQNNITLSPKKVTTTENVLKYSNDNLEQTFSSLKSDRIYLLSTDKKNITKKSINFESLNKYELTQENYLLDIEPNTNSTVRGEVLVEILRKMYEVLTTHVHNINEPYARTTYDSHKEMENLFKTIEDDLLNKMIRIN